MKEWANRVLANGGVQPRAFWALVRVMILMDLRGQHFAKATASQPHYGISPLFLVVGQCLLASAVTSLVFFARVDAVFYVAVNLTLSALLIATTVLVEFHEVALDPKDLAMLGHQPISSRTYALARFANLGFYVALMHVALNLMPMIVGAGLRDVGWWYMPSYALASVALTSVTVAVVIIALSVGEAATKLEPVKEALAWTQILLILIVGYGGQLMFKDGAKRIEVFAAFPPDWTHYVPTVWLAWFVEAVSQGTWSAQTGLGVVVGLVVLTLAAAGATIWRLTRLYAEMRPYAAPVKLRMMPVGQAGRLSLGWWDRLGWIRNPGERVGYWMAKTMPAREIELRMRCLMAINLAVAVVILGLATGQFANPIVNREASLVLLSILAVYLVPLSAPAIIHNLTYSRDSDAGWIFQTASLIKPHQVGLGVCKAVWVRFLLPICGILALAEYWVWRDLLGVALHAGLAAALCWLAALVGLVWVARGYPFSIPYARGASTGPLIIPMAALSALVSLLAGLHYLFAAAPWFWIVMFAATIVGSVILERRAESVLEHWREAVA